MSLGVNVCSLSHLTGCAHGLLYFSTSWSSSDEHPWTSNNAQATTKTARKFRTVPISFPLSQTVKRFLQFWRYCGRLNAKAYCRVYQQKYSVSLKITFLHERSVSGSKLWQECTCEVYITNMRDIAKVRFLLGKINDDPMLAHGVCAWRISRQHARYPKDKYITVKWECNNGDNQNRLCYQ